jgi:AcrR family transcriptional regulator
MPTRAEARARTEQRILEIGREHLATYGAAALSLRAVARDLGVVSSAVYRYVDSRDELLTRLLVDAYDELADAVEAAHASAATPRAQVLAAARAFRAWGRAEPARYALLYGSPVPGYAAPAERTSGPGTRVIGLLLGTLDGAGVSAPGPSGLDLSTLRAEAGVGLDDGALEVALRLWATIVGLTSLEVFGQLGPDPVVDVAALLDVQVGAALDVLGLTS